MCGHRIRSGYVCARCSHSFDPDRSEAAADPHGHGYPLIGSPTKRISLARSDAVLDDLIVNDGIKVLLQVVAKSLLPYPDPIHRRRLRREARALVSWTKWPGDDATTLEVAELALVRLLWLQREAHKAARSKQKEATALLARSAIDTCVTGTWCIYGADTVERLRDQNARALDRMMKYLVGSIITRDFLDRAVAIIGEPIAPLDLGRNDQGDHR